MSSISFATSRIKKTYTGEFSANSALFQLNMLMNITLRNVILNKNGLKSLETNQLTWRLGLSFLGSSNFALCEELLVP